MWKEKFSADGKGNHLTQQLFESVLRSPGPLKMHGVRPNKKYSYNVEKPKKLWKGDESPTRKNS